MDDDVTQAMSKGGACECPRVGLYVSNFGRVDDVTRAMSKAIRGCSFSCEFICVVVFGQVSIVPLPPLTKAVPIRLCTPTHIIQ